MTSAKRTLTDSVSNDSFGANGGLLPYNGIILVSGAYQAADPAPIEFTPVGATDLKLLIDITVISGAGATLTVTVEGWNKAASSWVPVLVSAGLVAVATTTLHVSPNMTAAANVTANATLYETMRVRPVKSGTTTTLTYSIGGNIS